MKPSFSRTLEAFLVLMLVALGFEVWLEQNELRSVCEEVRQEQGLWIPFEPGFVRVLEHEYFRCDDITIQIDY